MKIDTGLEIEKYYNIRIFISFILLVNIDIAYGIFIFHNSVNFSLLSLITFIIEMLSSVYFLALLDNERLKKLLGEDLVKRLFDDNDCRIIIKTKKINVKYMYYLTKVLSAFLVLNSVAIIYITILYFFHTKMLYKTTWDLYNLTFAFVMFSGWIMVFLIAYKLYTYWSIIKEYNAKSNEKNTK